MKKYIALAVSTAALTAGGLFVSSAFSSDDDEGELPSKKFGIAAGTTADGKTFGSGLDAEHGGPTFDLISAIGDHARQGYVDRKELDRVFDELDKAGPNSDRLADFESGKVMLPVYDTSGKTQIDTYTIGPANHPGIVKKRTSDH